MLTIANVCVVCFKKWKVKGSDFCCNCFNAKLVSNAGLQVSKSLASDSALQVSGSLNRGRGRRLVVRLPASKVSASSGKAGNRSYTPISRERKKN